MKKVISMLVVVAMLTAIFAAGVIPNSWVLASQELTLKVGSVQGSSGTTVKIPVELSGVPASGINNSDFILSYDPSVLDVEKVEPGDIIIGGREDFGSNVNASRGRIATMFVDETGVGDRMIATDGTYAIITAKILKEEPTAITLANDNGVFADYNLNLIPYKFEAGGVNLGSAPPITPTPTVPVTAPPTGDGPLLTVASVKASVGTTVEIPVYLTGVPSSGINNCDFILWYEPSVIEVTSITPGDIVTGGREDFGSHINKDRGRLSFMFVDETGVGDRMIKKDGVFATITAKV
ncbi:MAG TPA: cellulosomal-scaffolding protein A, partial [Clostridium sp.]|nr:cellulosomal-scaffolding protein A [Clostridium sp.]